MDLSRSPDEPCRFTSGRWCWPHGRFCGRTEASTLDRRQADAVVVIDINGCARCDGDGHKDLEFKKFIRSAGEEGQWTHWAMCPETNEPILMGFFDATT